MKTRPKNDWTPIRYLDDNYEIPDDIQVIHCDTRDFCVVGSEDKPKIHKNPTCGWEDSTNKGLQRLYNLFTKTDRSGYSIPKTEIFKWLKEVCEKTGGYDTEWRCIVSDIRYGSNWDLKYLRFVRDDKERDNFIVCNSYMFPIKYKELIPNLRWTI